MRIVPLGALLLALAVALAGCVTQPYAQIDALRRPAAEPRVVLLPPDIELAEVSAGGHVGLNAEWTREAYAHIGPALREEAATLGLHVVEGRTGDTGDDPARNQIVALHAAVGNAVLTHLYTEGEALPTKAGKLDWTLGPAVRSLAGSSGADYALFVHVRDSYTSGARAAVIMVGVLFGVALPGGSQVGFASLVDLESGDVVWFNRLARSEGDLRNLTAARETVRQLLAGLPR